MFLFTKRVEGKQMKILLITYFFPPETHPGGERAYSFCKYFPKNGIEVVLLTSKEDLNENQLKKEIDISALYVAKQPRLREWGYKTKILALLELLKIDKMLFFPDTRFPWIKRAFKQGEKAIKEHKIDCILVSAPIFTAFVTANNLSKKYNIPLILDYRDPWNGSPYIKYPNKLTERRYRKKELEIINQASSIVTVSEECAKLIAHNIEKPVSEIDVVYNGFFHEKIPKFEQEEKNKSFTITYVGSLYILRRKPFTNFLKGFYDFVNKEGLTEKDIQINYAGMTSRNYIIRMLEATNTHEYFKDLGFIHDKKEYYKILQKTHILPLMIPEKGEYALPTKLFDYMITNSHILFIGNQGSPTQMCDKTKQIYDLTNDNPSEISKKLSTIYQDWKENKLKYGCDLEILKNFSRENQAKVYTDILKEKIGNK